MKLRSLIDNGRSSKRSTKIFDANGRLGCCLEAGVICHEINKYVYTFRLIVRHRSISWNSLLFALQRLLQGWKGPMTIVSLKWPDCSITYQSSAYVTSRRYPVPSLIIIEREVSKWKSTFSTSLGVCKIIRHFFFYKFLPLNFFQILVKIIILCKFSVVSKIFLGPILGGSQVGDPRQISTRCASVENIVKIATEFRIKCAAPRKRITQQTVFVGWLRIIRGGAAIQDPHRRIG